MAARRPLHCALLGLRHPHSAALLATLDRLPEIGAISLWEDAPGAASAAELPGSRKVRLISGDLTAVLERSGADFATVCVRPDLGAALARRVFAAGLHLLTEKPVGLASADILPLIRAAKRSGLHASVLYPNRLHPVVQEARRLCQAGELGPLITLEGRFLTTQVGFRDPRSWLFQRRRAGGGILTWLGCHYLDLLQYVSGDEVTAVSAQFARRSGEAIDVEDSAALTLRFRSGAVGTFHAAYALAFSGGGYMNATGSDAYLACNGRRGRVVWPCLHESRLDIELPGDPQPVRSRPLPLPAGETAGSYCRTALVRAFVAALHGKAEAPAPLSAALRTARLIEAAHRAHATGRRVRVIPTEPRIGK